jgi:autotransporter-associated beta strand protein
MFERRLAVEQSKPITMKTPFIFQKVIWLACWTSAGLAVPGYAVDWIPGVGANWSDSSRWVGGIVPNGFTGFAEFTTNPTNTNGNQQITLDIDVVLNLMNIGETVSNAGDALQTYTITSTGGRTITFNNGGAVPVPLLTKTGGATDVLNARVILAESTDFNIGGGVLRIGGNTPNAGIQVGLGSGDLKILNKLGGSTLDITGTTTILADGKFESRAGTTNFSGLINRFNGGSISGPGIEVIGGTVNFSGVDGAYSFTGTNSIKNTGGTINFGTTTSAPGSSNFLIAGKFDVDNGTVNIGRDGAAANLTMSAGNLEVARGTVRLQNGNGNSAVEGVTNLVGGAPIVLSSSSVTGNQIDLADTSGLFVGMRVFGPGLTNGATITTVNAGSIVLSSAPTAGANQVFMAASGRQVVGASGVIGSTTVTITSGTAGFTTGMVLTGAGVPEGAVVTAVNAGSVEISEPLTAVPTTVSAFARSDINMTGGTIEMYQTGNAEGTVNMDPSVGLSLAQTPVVTNINGTVTAGDAVVPVATSAGMAAGMLVEGPGIVPGTTVAGVNVAGPNTITLSIPPTGSGSGALTLSLLSNFNISDNRGTIQNHTMFSMNSTSDFSVLRSNANSSGLTVGNSSGVNDIFNATVNFSGSTSRLTKVGLNTLTLGGVGANTNLRVTVNGGTLVLNKASAPNTNAISGPTVVGDADVAIETIRVQGSSLVASPGLANFNDQISRGSDMTVNASGVLDLNGFSEGFNQLIGAAAGGLVTNTATGTLARLTIGENNGGSTFLGSINAGAAGLGQLELYKAGTGTIVLNGSHDFTGATVVGGGTLTLGGATGALLGTTSIILDGGTLLLNNATNNNTNRLPNSPITLSKGGVLSVNNNSGAVNVDEVVGGLTVNSGVGSVRLNRSNNVENSFTRLSLGSLTVGSGSHLVVSEQSAVTNAGFATSLVNASSVRSQVTVGAIPTLVGGGGAGGTSTISIIPGAFGGVKGGATGDFLTVQNLLGANYIRPLLASEYSTLTSGVQSAANSVVTALDTVIAQNTFANVLKVAIGASNSSVSVQDGAILKLGGNANAAHGTITSGAGMIASSSSATGITSIVGGTLDFGIREGRIRANNGMIVSSMITGQAGLSKSGAGLLELAGGNSYTGLTSVLEQGAEGGVLVWDSRALGATGTGNGTQVIQSSLLLGSGVTIGGGLSAGLREDLVLEAGTFLRAQSRSNTWYGDVNLSAGSAAGQGSGISITTRDGSALTLMGAVTGGGSALNATHVDSNSARRLDVTQQTGAGNGLIFFEGAVSDRLGASASGAVGFQEKLHVRVAGQDTAGVANNEFNVFMNDATKVNGQLDLRSGVVHLGSSMGSDLPPGTVDTLFVRLKNLGTTDAVGVEDQNQIGALLFNTPGSTLPVNSISWGDGNAGYHASSYGIIGADITSGKITIGTGVGTLDVTPEADAGITSSRTGVTINDDNPRINVGSTTGLRPGMFVTGAGIPAGAYLVRVVDATTIIINTNPTATTANTTVNFNATQRYADARLYAREGGTLEMLMRVLDDGGFSLENEVAGLTKTGRGTVVMGGSGGTGDIDGGINLHGGTLVFDYGVNNTRIVSGGATQAPLTLGGGELFLKGSSTNGGFTEDIRGLIYMRPGDSKIHVQASGLTNVTTLNLGLSLSLGNSDLGTNIVVREMPLRSAGSSMNFWEDISNSGSVTINMFIPTSIPQHGVDFSNFALPWALYANNTTGGINDFAVVDTNATVRSLTSVSGYDFVDNAASWGNLVSGTVTEDFGFTGVTPVIDRNTQFFNNIRFSADTTSTLTVNSAGLQFQSEPQFGVLGGAILVSADIANPAVVKTITGGALTSELQANYYGTTTSSRDLLLHNHGAGLFKIESNIANNIPGGTLTGPLNLVHNGTGITQLVGAKTYTGRTFLNGGDLWVQDPNHLGTVPVSSDPGNLSFNGGRLRVASFSDPAGTALGGVGGFVLSGNRGVTIGGNGAWIMLDNVGTRIAIGGLIASEANAPEFAGGITRTTNLGVGDLILEGNGRLVLSNQGNSYNGLTEIRGGVLQAEVGQSKSTVLGSNITTIDGTIVSAGARLDILSAGTAAQQYSSEEWVTLKGGTLGTASGHVDASLDGLISVDASSTFDVASGVLRLNRSSGVVRGVGDLTKTGAGTLVLGQSNPLFEGQINIRAGTVIGTSQRLSMGTGSTIQMGDSTVVSAASANLLLNSLSTSSQNFASEYSIDQAIQINPSLNDGLILTFQEKRLGARAYLDTTQQLRGAQFDRFSFNGNVSLGDDLILSYTDNVVNPGILAGGRDQTLAFNGNFSGAGNLRTEINYEGNTAANQNDLRIYYLLNGNNAGWSGVLTSGNATNDADLQHIVRLGQASGLTSGNQVNLRFNSTLQAGGKTVQMGNLNVLPAGIAAGTGAAGAGIVVENASTESGTFIINQTIDESWDVLFRDGQYVGAYATPGTALVSQPLSVVKAGAGVATLTQANTYTGSTQVGTANGPEGGTLRISTGGSISSNSPITVFGGVLEFNGVNHTANQVVTLGGGASGTKSAVRTGVSTLTLGAGSNIAFDGSNGSAGGEVSGTVQMGSIARTFNVADSIGAAIDLDVKATLLGSSAGSLIKTGAGTMALSGNNNFTGGVTINQGALLANNTSGSATGLGAVVVNPGGVLGGTGTIAGDVTLSNGIDGPDSGRSILAPGSPAISSGIELLNLQGSVTIGENALIDFYLGQTGFTQLNFATLGNVPNSTKFRINLMPSYTPSAGASFDLIDWAVFANAGDTNWVDNLILPVGPVWDSSLFSTTGVLKVSGSTTQVSIVTQPAALVTVDPGTPATFSVVVAGTEPWILQWRKGGVAIPGATSLSYTIPVAVEADEGLYSVEITNGGVPVVSSDSNLVVNDTPQITVQPAALTVRNPGTSATLSVTAVGATTYTWRRDGQQVQTGPSNTLALTNLAEVNQGTYVVEVANAAGSVFSADAVLEINDAVVILTQPQGFQVPRGTVVTFSVSAAGTGPLTYQWFRGTTAVGTNSPNLEVTAAVGTFGSYTVRVSNVVGPLTSAAASLVEVGGEVNIVTQPTPQIVPVGGTLTLTCVATGGLPLKYQWRLNGKNISGATSSTFTATSVATSRAGSYSCFVSNVIGTGPSSATSAAVDVGVVNTAARKLILREGTSTTLSVTAAGNVSYQWFKNNGSGETIIPSGTSRTLTVSNSLMVSDKANYYCRVTLIAGGLSLDGGMNDLTVFNAVPDINMTGHFTSTIISEPYSFQVPLAEGPNPPAPDPARTPTKWVATGLPPGLTINSEGLVSGRATAVRFGPDKITPIAYLVRITASNSVGSDFVADRELLVQPLPGGVVGVFTGRVARAPALTPPATGFVGTNFGLGGRIDVTTTTKGTYSGKLLLGATTYSFKGALNTNALSPNQSTATTTIARSKTTPLTLSFTLDAVDNLLKLGSVTDGTTTAAVDGWRSTWTNAVQATAYQGYYTFGLDIPNALNGTATHPNIPQGMGYGSFTVAGATGKLSVAGRLSDGTSYTSATFVGPTGQILIFRTLYAVNARGSVLGQLNVTLGGSNDLNTLAGTVNWWRPATPGTSGRTYAAGFDPMDLTGVGSRYTPPVSPNVVMNINGLLPANTANSRVNLVEANVESALPVPSFVDFNVNPTHKALAVSSNGRGVTLKITPKTGVVTGGFKLSEAHPDAVNGGKPAVINRTVSYFALIVKDGLGEQGIGYFMLPQLPATAAESNTKTPILSGQVTFTKLP